MSSAAQGGTLRKPFYLLHHEGDQHEEEEDDGEFLYNSHVQWNEPRDFKKRLVECQKEIGKLQDTVAEYQVFFPI